MNVTRRRLQIELAAHRGGSELNERANAGSNGHDVHHEAQRQTNREHAILSHGDAECVQISPIKARAEVFE